MRGRWRAAATGLAVAVALTACSSTTEVGSGGGSSTTAAAEGSGPSTTTEGTGTTTGTAPEEEATGAAGALLQADDLGEGWTMAPGTATKSTSEAFFDVPGCAALVPAAGTGAPADEMAQALYADGNSGLQVQYQVDVYADAADAAPVIELAQNPDFGTCFSDAIATGVTEATIDSVTVTPLTVTSASDLGIDAVAAVEIDVQMTSTGTDSAGEKGSVLAHVVVLQHGSAIGAFTVAATSLGSTPPPFEVNEATLQAAATKLQTVGS